MRAGSNCESIVLKLSRTQAGAWLFPEIEITFCGQAPQRREIATDARDTGRLCIAAIIAYLKFSGRHLKTDLKNQSLVGAFQLAKSTIVDSSKPGIKRESWARKAFKDVSLVPSPSSRRANPHPINSIIKCPGYHTAQWAANFDPSIVRFHLDGGDVDDGQHLRPFIQEMLGIDLPRRVVRHSANSYTQDTFVCLAPVDEELSGSTPPTDRPLAEECMRQFDLRVRGLSGGAEVTITGGFILLRFTNPVNAVEVAVNIQRSLAEEAILLNSKTFRVRIGIDVRTASRIVNTGAHENIVATPINEAARYVRLAGASQILISEEIHVVVRNAGDHLSGITFHDWGDWCLRGVGEKRVFEVLFGERPPARPSGLLRAQASRFSMPFVGRADDLRAVSALLRSQAGRLVTLKGEGGIGKTRLADEVANRLGEYFAAVHWVELEATADSEAAVENEIRVQCGLNRSATLEEFFRNKSALVVLNNFESVMAARELVRRLRNGCGGLHLLVTSRVQLHLDGEQIHDLDPMELGDARQAFVAYARLKDSRFALTRDNAKQIDDIIELTDRIPFYIELTAAQVRPGRSLEAIRILLKNRLSLVSHEMPSARHRNIAACLDTSFGLLTVSEQSLFAHLTVFRGGLLPADVDVVCQMTGSVQLLDVLHDASLLRLSDDRYFMLSTVADYARSKLTGEELVLQQRHADHYLGKLQDAARKIPGSRYREGFAQLRAEFENCRAGMDWAVNQGDDRMVILYSRAFAGNLFNLGRAAAELEFCKKGLDAAQRQGADRESVASAHNNLGNAYWYLHSGNRSTNLSRAVGCYREALRLNAESHFPETWADSQNGLGTAYRHLTSGDRGDNLKQAIACYEAALGVYTEQAFPEKWAMTQANLGKAYRVLPTGDRESHAQLAIACFEAALRVRTEQDFPVAWAATKRNVGEAYLSRVAGDRGSNVQHAIKYYEASLRVRTERDFPVEWAMTQNNLGSAYNELPVGDQGANVQRAIAFFESALRVFIEQDFPAPWAATQHNLGEAYAKMPTGDREGNLLRAIAFFKSALRVRTESNFPANWAITQDSLGLAYSAFPTGTRSANLRKAAVCYEEAIRGYRAVGLNQEAEEVATRLTSEPFSSHAVDTKRAIDEDGS